MAKGFLYLVAIIDWASGAVLAWRLSNTMDTAFCLEALHEALVRFGKPEIFNTDQGAQFTSTAFTGRLQTAGIRISMDGRGRWMDNVFIERVWRSLKYEEVHLKAYTGGHEARAGIGEWMIFYNTRRFHQALGYKTPMAVWSAGKTRLWTCRYAWTTQERCPHAHSRNNKCKQQSQPDFEARSSRPLHLNSTGPWSRAWGPLQIASYCYANQWNT